MGTQLVEYRSLARVLTRTLPSSGAIGVIALSALIHCGDPDMSNPQVQNTADPCTTVLSGQCGAACVTDIDCPSGLHCGAQGTCTAECTAGSSVCGNGVCTDRGRCSSGSSSGGSGGTGSSGGTGIVDPGPGTGNSTGNGGNTAVCANIELQLADLIPTVALLIDRSGSMDDYRLDGSRAGSKSTSPLRWDALRSGLTGPDSVIKTLEQKVRFGFVFYTNRSNPATCPDLDWGSEFAVSPPSDAQLWPPAFGKFAAFEEHFRGLTPASDTPTGESVTAVVTALDAVTEVGPKYIVLATDGDPDRCGAPDGHDDISKDGSVGAVQDAKATHEIGTFVIGIGKGAVTLDHLQDLANVGAGIEREQRPGAKYYEVGTQAELAGAFEEIISGVRTCSFTLNGEIDAKLASQGQVTLDDARLEFGSKDGWRVVDGKTIELVGNACTTVKSSGAHNLKATFPCDVVITPPK